MRYAEASGQVVVPDDVCVSASNRKIVGGVNSILLGILRVLIFHSAAMCAKMLMTKRTSTDAHRYTRCECACECESVTVWVSVCVCVRVFKLNFYILWLCRSSRSQFITRNANFVGFVNGSRCDCNHTDSRNGRIRKKQQLLVKCRLNFWTKNMLNIYWNARRTISVPSCILFLLHIFLDRRRWLLPWLSSPSSTTTSLSLARIKIPRRCAAVMVSVRHGDTRCHDTGHRAYRASTGKKMLFRYVNQFGCGSFISLCTPLHCDCRYIL